MTSKKFILMSTLWAVIRVYVGWQWLNAGWHKVTGEKAFDASGFIKGAIAKAVPASAGAKPIVQGWWAEFLKDFALPNIGLFNFLVQFGEVLVGVALIIGFASAFAASMGILMNMAFLLSGTVSSNANLLFLQFLMLALGSAYVGYVGVDYYFRPWFRKLMGKKAEGSAASA